MVLERERSLTFDVIGTCKGRRQGYLSTSWVGSECQHKSSIIRGPGRSTTWTHHFQCLLGPDSVYVLSYERLPVQA